MLNTELKKSHELWNLYRSRLIFNKVLHCTLVHPWILGYIICVRPCCYGTWPSENLNPDQMIRNGDVELQAREEEIRFMKMQLAEEKRAIDLLRKNVPGKKNLEQELVTLQIEVGMRILFWRNWTKNIPFGVSVFGLRKHNIWSHILLPESDYGGKGPEFSAESLYLPHAGIWASQLSSSNWCHMIQKGHVTLRATSCHPQDEGRDILQKIQELFHNNLTLRV